MFISETISTTYGRRLAAPPRPLLIPRSPDAAAAFAVEADHAAAEAFSSGQFARADRLTLAAITARAGAGGRA